jgi:hypothetical protein
VIQENRIIEFIVRDSLIECYPQFIKEILAPLLIVRAEQRYDIRGVAYLAYGIEFNSNPKNYWAPKYYLDIDIAKNTLTPEEREKYKIPEYSPSGWRFIPCS